MYFLSKYKNILVQKLVCVHQIHVYYFIFFTIFHYKVDTDPELGNIYRIYMYVIN